MSTVAICYVKQFTNFPQIKKKLTQKFSLQQSLHNKLGEGILPFSLQTLLLQSRLFSLRKCWKSIYLFTLDQEETIE